MAEFETPPTFSGVRYDVQPMNIGEGYAKGISQAGEGIAKGISSVFDVMNRRQNATDMLNALHQGGVLSDDQYKSVAGKSLGAQEQMLGMYSNQWILDQANKRAMALQQGQGATQIAVEHAKLLDTINAVKSGYGTAAGVNIRNILAQPGQQQGGQQQPGQVAPVAPLTVNGAALPLPRNLTPQMVQQAQQMSGTPAAPTPLGSGNIYAPGPKLGVPMSPSDKITVPGSSLVQGTGPNGQVQHFVKLPDGTLRPILQQ